MPRSLVFESFNLEQGMTDRKGKKRCVAMALFFVLFFAPLAGAAKPPEAPAPAVKPQETKAIMKLKAAAAAMRPHAASGPEIKRIATFQSAGGEKLLHSPLALARDAKSGDLIITSFGSGEVVILDAKGFLLNRAGREVGLIAPYGVAIDKTGRIFLSEVQTGILKILSPGGILLDKIDLSLAAGKQVAPGRISIGRDGHLYVADLRANEILIFNSRGDFLRALGGFAYLQKAAAIGDRIIGLSAHGKAVHLFDQEGKLLLTFGEHGEEAERTFSFPTGFAVDAKGRLWIADAFQHRLKIFSMEGNHLFNFGRMEEETGGFFFPVDLCFGEEGKLFVLEKGAERIQIFQVSDLK